MLNILVADFQLESNEHVPTVNTIDDFITFEGEEIVKQMHIDDLCNKHEVNAIPAFFHEIFAGSVLEKRSFEIIEKELLDTLKANLKILDGIYLFLHGASRVLDLEGISGEQHLLKQIRKVVGPYFPIAVVMDPHGNTSKEYIESIDIARCFRQSPHTDNIDTRRYTFELFVDYLKKRRHVHSVYLKLPLILGGESSVSTDEPMLSINKFLDEKEKDERIMSASFYIGYIRHDSPHAGTAVVVVPNNEEDTEYARKVANEIGEYVMARRKEFHFTGKSLSKEEAIEDALNYVDKPYIITDSGDNVTSGSTGYNTFILRQFLDADLHNKKVLISAITDPELLKNLKDTNIGENKNINIGMNIDELSKTVNLDVKIISRADLVSMGKARSKLGEAVTVKVKDKEIYIVVIGRNYTFAELEQFAYAGINPDDYDIIVVKQGYIFPELKAYAKDSCMSLTAGATYQDVKSIPFKMIKRPMYPIDEF